MSDNFNSVARDVYSVRLDQAPNADVRWIPGAASPVQLALALRDHISLKRALAMPPQGAILEIHMRPEDAMKLFSDIRQLARTMGWSLPKEDEAPA